MRCIRWDVWIRRLSAGAAVGYLASSAAWPLAAAADDETPRTRAGSPYFFVKSDDPSVDRLPLKSTNVDVKIAGVIADVTVTQRYRNEGRRSIEARYVFPGGTRSAIDGMTVRLADRVLTANIREKQAARVEYETAKSAGRTAALLEQHRANVFEMNVANILPGDDVAVELHDTELIVPVDGKYQFVFPTVVGPRYNGSSLRELLYAVEMEQTLGKARMLQVYLAVAPWGDGVCGADAAAARYFHVAASRLSGAQAVWLAAMLHAPDTEFDRWEARGGIDLGRATLVARGLPRTNAATRARVIEDLATMAGPVLPATSVARDPDFATVVAVSTGTAR